ncbi:S-layer homology domain-containing protein [Patescibacteria group bacterium]
MAKKKYSMGTESLSFLAVLILFAGFSVYSFISFFNSTNDYINQMQADVIGGTEQLDIVATTNDAPPECVTCPPVDICMSVCPNTLDPDTTSTEPYPIFTDLMSNDPGAVAVEALMVAGIIHGYEDGTFKPNNSINRAELLTTIINAVDGDLAGGLYENCFTDVTTEWFAPFVCYAKYNGWVNGYEDGSYRPGNTVIKAEALKIVLVAFKYEVPATVDSVPFTDVPYGDWYAPYAVVAAENGIVLGYGAFDAAHEMTRVEFMEMVYNAMLAKGLI